METVEIEFFQKQFEVLNFKTQFGLLCAGSQGGKTFVGSCWAAKKFQENDNTTGLIFAPTYKILRQSTLIKFFSLFPQFRRYYKEQKGEIIIGNRTIFLRSADDPLTLEGMTLNWAWGDEAGMMARLVWSVIRSRVSTTNGPVLLTTTPHFMNWIYTEFYIPWIKKQDKELSFFTWESIENKRFSKEMFEAERKRLRPEEFARRYGGKFERMEGLVYDTHEIEIKSFSKRVQYIAGVDWGYKHPAAIVIIAIEDNKYYIADEWEKTGKTTAQIIDVLKQFISIYKIRFIYPDPAEPDRIFELSNAGIPSQKVTKDIKGGISYLQQLTNEGRLFVFDSCRNYIDEANTYHYPENRTSDLPVKSNDDLMDSARYAIFSYHLDKKEDVTDYIIAG